MKKIRMFVFNGDPMCFIHVLLNAIDMHEKDYDVKIVIEGASTKLLPDPLLVSDRLQITTATFCQQVVVWPVNRNLCR